MTIETSRRNFFSAAAGIAGLSVMEATPAFAKIEPEPWGIKLGIATYLAPHVRSGHRHRNVEEASVAVDQH
jgi:hypothetical protein